MWPLALVKPVRPYQARSGRAGRVTWTNPFTSFDDLPCPSRSTTSPRVSTSTFTSRRWRGCRRLLRRTYTPRVMEWPGGFAGLFRLDDGVRLLTRKYRDPVLVASTDGVGTKLKLAFATGRHETVGIDLVAMSVNDCLCAGRSRCFSWTTWP